MASETLLQIPRVDFSGLDLKQSGTPGWDMVRAQVMQGLDRYGCFEAVYNNLRPELREEFFGNAVKELFSLPLETKSKQSSDKLFHGYLGQLPGLDYESLALEDPQLLHSAQRLTSQLWPEGNPGFCDSLCSFAKQMVELEQVVQRMILESLGIEKYYDSHNASNYYLFRMAEYGSPQNPETKLCLDEHKDQCLLSIICQHQVPGLEIKTKDGDWIQVSPSPNSVIVLTGDAFEAWSNGRLCPPRHRVMVSGYKTRYSSILSTMRKDGHTIEAPKELVDEEHPLLFKPFYLGDYIRFCTTETGMNAKHSLKAYCGIEEQGIQA